MGHEGWAAVELGAAALGDRRRTQRLMQMASAFAARPAASIPAACGSAAATKAAYRFFDDDAVAADAIVAAHVRATALRAEREPLVLAVQAATLIDLSAPPALEGAGPLAHPQQHGLLIHSVLATSDAGVPLGLLHQQRWARDPDEVGRRRTRRQRTTAEKESQRWLDALAATHAALPPGTPVLGVADREADLHDLFALPRPAESEVLIRATHNRRVDHEARYLREAVERSVVCGELTVEIGRRDARPARTATLTLRAVALALLPPHRRPDPGDRPSGAGDSLAGRHPAHPLAAADHHPRRQRGRGGDGGAPLCRPLGDRALPLRAQARLRRRGAATAHD